MNRVNPEILTEFDFLAGTDQRVGFSTLNGFSQEADCR
jgi:hypothetical protein